MFSKNNYYRHSNPSSSLDILVLSICHTQESYTKLKIKYIHKNSGRAQHTGIGLKGDTDTIKIKKEHFKDWKNITEQYKGKHNG